MSTADVQLSFVCIP